MRALVVYSIILFQIKLFGQPVNLPLKISQLTGNSFVFTTYNDPGDGSRYPANGMYIVTTHGVVLIDSPWDSTQFQPLLDSTFIKHHQQVILNIATHFHADRTAGFDYFKSKGIKTYSSKQTYDLCKKRHEPQAQYYFTKDTVFHIGDQYIETYYPGRGHAPDNIVIWFKKTEVLFGGCLVKSTETNSPGNLADADLVEWKTSIQHVLKKYPRAKYVIPGHLGWTDKRSLQHTIEVLREIKNQ